MNPGCSQCGSGRRRKRRKGVMDVSKRSQEPRVAVVTGGAGGVGLASARRLGRRHVVVLADTSEERLALAVESLRDVDIDAMSVVCDVRDRASVAELARAAGERGPLGALVHTAGLSSSMADARTIIEVNLVGTALVIGGFRAMAAEGSVAVCLASVSAHRHRASEFDGHLADPLAPSFVDALIEEARLTDNTSAAYALSKRGVVLLCEREAKGWGERGARIISLSPGLVDTPMGEREANRGGAGLVARSIGRRPASADEVAAVVEFVASPEAGYITGTDIRIDGGSIAAFVHHASAEERLAWDDPWHGR